MTKRAVLCAALLTTACQNQVRQEESAKAQPTAIATTSDAKQIAQFWKDVAAVHFKEDRSHAGEPISAAQLLDKDGKAVTLASLRGRPVLVNFWAHWCVPCRAEMPTINEMVAQRHDPLTVVAVNEDVVQPSSKSLGPLTIASNIREWSDPKGMLAKSLANSGLPTTVLFGRDGRERWRLVGVLDWTKPQAQKLLTEAS